MLDLNECEYAPFMRDKRFIKWERRSLVCEELRYTAWKWLLVENAPTWAEVHEDVSRIVQSAPLVIFNAEFDMQMMAQTSALYGLPPITANKGLRCALWLYAAYFGEWKEDDGRYRRQSLQRALEYEKVVIDVPAHRALGDTLRTLALIESMADCRSVD